MVYKIFRKKIFLVAFMCFLFAAVSLLSSCTQVNLFEENTNIPQMKWKYDFSATGNFQITDTISNFNVYIILRHTDAYQYNNIWLNIGVQPPGDSMQYQKVNLTLGNDAAGWEGIGMNDIWEVRKLISGSAKSFKKTGNYQFSISQIMRDNPLSNIMSVGLRLEKAP
jgi:gliding motility-associated lipoprotein GldH